MFFFGFVDDVVDVVFVFFVGLMSYEVFQVDYESVFSWGYLEFEVLLIMMFV